MHCMVVIAQLRMCTMSHLCSTNVRGMMNSGFSLCLLLHHMFSCLHMPEATFSTSCQTLFLHVGNVTKSNTNTTSTKFYTTCPCTTYK